MNANLIVVLVKLASRVAFNTVKLKQNSLRRTLKSLPLKLTSCLHEKRPTNTPTMTLLMKNVLGKIWCYEAAYIGIKVYLEASGCRHANATPSRGIFRL